jgi:hypothetical protein
MYTLQEVRHMLATNQAWVQKAIIRLYERQTADEQASDDTKYHNNKGFNSSDARRLSYYAKYILSGRNLSGKHLAKAHKMVPKYAGQILSLINQNQHETA